MSDPSVIEVTLCDLDAEALQAVTQVFDRYGRGGAVIEELFDECGEARTCVKTFVGSQETERLRHIEISLELLNRVRVMQQQPPIAPPRLRVLTETDWAEAWKAGYHPFRVGRRLVIKPSWEVYHPLPHERVIEIDPGMAFGSGLHATTRLCLTLLEEHLHRGDTVLDLGSGSGILAIAAARLGAAHVLALDIDPEAVRIARDNVQRNGLESMVLVHYGTIVPDGMLQCESPPAASSSHPSGPERWNIILANLLAATIIELASALARNLLPNGVLIASGMITEQSQEVSAALSAQGLEIVAQRSEDDWVALCARRPSKANLSDDL
ncbi:MAG: 50S ribosomal protein L11 methyltransferase [Ardenticatenia bacterium]|jgi:ribosomal protein L11 methyltransferase|nr:MAG: 50S ribosomal protein L11 methyltransferase [Ardenticatenia bacterium]